MGRIKNTENFGRRNKPSQDREPYKVFILAFEGTRTEHDYFSMVNDHKEELGIHDLIKIELIERIDTKSSPAWVLDTLKEFKDTYQVDENDYLWMVIDRDKQSNPKAVLESVIKECEQQNFNIAVTNPCFELWLLLHCISDIKEYDADILLENPKKNKNAKKRFIENELTRINGSYNKKRLVKKHFIDLSKIKKALKLERDIENDPYKILDNLGSNVGALVSELLDEKSRRASTNRRRGI